MLVWPFVSAEQWQQYLLSQGYDPSAFNGTAYEETFICEICQTELGDEPYAILEPPPGLIVRRKFHNPCLVAHLLAHLDDMQDEISNYIARKLTSS